MTDSQAKAAQLEAMREALACQYHKPVLPVPQGEHIQGRVVAAFAGDSARMRVVVESERAVHVVGVGADQAREMLGMRVAVSNEHGSLILVPSEFQPKLDVGELQSLLECKALDAGTAASFSRNTDQAQRAIGAETAYRDVLAHLDRTVYLARSGPSSGNDRGH